MVGRKIILRNCWEQVRGYVSEMEHEKRNISSDYIDLLANIFKIEPHELLINRLPVEIRRIARRKR